MALNLQRYAPPMTSALWRGPHDTSPQGQRQVRDRRVSKTAVFREPRGQLAPKHPGRADDEDTQAGRGHQCAPS